MVTIGPERHPYADLVGAATGIIGSHSIQPDGSQNKRKNSEERGEARNQPLLRELTGHLVFQSVNRNDRQIRIDRSHGLTYSRDGQAGSRLGQNDNVMQHMRAWTHFGRTRLRRKVMLGFGQKEERSNRLAEVEMQIAGIFGNAYNFVLARSETVPAEVFSNWIFILEKLPRKRLVD